MTKTVEVEIDETGDIRPVDGSTHLPKGRATLVFETGDHEMYRLSEYSLRDWLCPEEDEAWAYLQQDKS